MTELMLSFERKLRRSGLEVNHFIPFLILVTLLGVGAASTPHFLEIDNLTNVFARSSFIAIISIGATFVVTAGEIDLSVGAVSALVAGLVIYFFNLGWIDNVYVALITGILLAFFFSALSGCINGLLVGVGHIEPFVATLCTMAIARSVLVWLATGGAITLKWLELRELFRPIYFGSILGLPIPLLITLVAAAIGSFILHRSRFGRHITAVGSNSEVALFAGIHVRRIRILTYICQGICIAIAVLIYIARWGSATQTTAASWELQTIAAVVIGGTPLRGGYGRIWGAVCGAWIMELIANLMVLSSLGNEYLIGALQGVIVLAIMLVQRMLQRKAEAFN